MKHKKIFVHVMLRNWFHIHWYIMIIMSLFRNVWGGWCDPTYTIKLIQYIYIDVKSKNVQARNFFFTMNYNVHRTKKDVMIYGIRDWRGQQLSTVCCNLYFGGIPWLKYFWSSLSSSLNLPSSPHEGCKTW